MSKTLLTTTKYTTSNDFIPFFFFSKHIFSALFISSAIKGGNFINFPFPSLKI